MTKSPHSTTRRTGRIGRLESNPHPAEPPPHSIETEQYCLGGMMQDPDSWPAVSKIISGSDFYLDSHRTIFDTIKAQAEKGNRFDLVTVAEALDSDGVMVDTDPLPGIEPSNWRYLGAMIDQTATAVNVTTYARIVRRKALERRRMGAIAKDDHHKAAALTAAIDQLEASGRKQSRLISIQELCGTPPAEHWLIKGYVPIDSIGTAFGDPEGGKSFVLIDLAGHVATGRPWRGMPVKQGPVVYVAGEGRNGLAKRFKAWFEHHGEELRNIYLLTTPTQLTDPASVAALIEDIKALPEQPVLIEIDTINRNFGPGDENSTGDMTLAVAGLDALRTATGATVLGAHHCGHNEKSRGRGSSVLRASLDFEFSIERFDRTVQIRCTKAKDFDHPPPLAWTFEPQALPWADDEGTPINSAVLVPASVVSRQSFTVMNARERLACAVLEQQGPMLVGDWRTAFYEAVRRTDPDIKPDTLRKAWVRIEPKLVDSGAVTVTNNLASLPGQTGQNRTFPDLSGDYKPDMPGQTGHTPIGVSGCPACPDSPDVADSDGNRAEPQPTDSASNPGDGYADSLLDEFSQFEPMTTTRAGPGVSAGLPGNAPVEPLQAATEPPPRCRDCRRFADMSRHCHVLNCHADPFLDPACGGAHFQPKEVW